ncbi:unnamed protein product [Schistosoma margrebowiei]|uniref:Uncharacterized protein n=1 Tax=Schistosoma margrebowiei TaxID=48269 RepID=A0A183LPJ9_9TREM|nr:unnamed protein product [Schistosoma margrebowiei]
MLLNHPGSSWMVCDPWTRRLSSEEKENLNPVILQSQSTDEVLECVKERTGKVVTAADRVAMKAKLFIGIAADGSYILRRTSEITQQLRYLDGLMSI